MMQETLDEERLKQMVIRGEVMHGQQGGWFFNDENIRSTFENIDKKINFTIPQATEKAKGEPNTSRMLVIPLSQLTPREYGKLGLRPERVNTTSAVLWCFLGLDVDSLNRNRRIDAMALMDNDNAQTMLSAVQKDPRTLFELTRAVNHGPVKKRNNIPIGIDPGTAVSIFRSNSTAPLISAPFPQGYVANPII